MKDETSPYQEAEDAKQARGEYLAEDEPYHQALPAYQQRPDDDVLRAIKAMKQNDEFLMRALRRAGVIA